MKFVIRKKSVMALGVLAAAQIFSGCMNSPRNGQEITSLSLPLNGYTIYPNDFVELDQWDWTKSQWVSLSQGVEPNGSSGIRDGASMVWYAFQGTVPISNQSNYWKSAPKVDDQRRIRTKLASYQWSAGYLMSYDTDADTCASQQAHGIAVANNCGSANYPAAEVFMPCGKLDQYCCIASDIEAKLRCDTGALCDGLKCSIPAGGSNKPCNINGPACRGERACIDGICRNTHIENLPVLTAELRVKTCNDTSWVSYGSGSNFSVGLGTTKTLVNNPDDPNDDQVVPANFYIEVPGKELQAGRTDTFGLKLPKIKTVGDIKELRGTLNAGAWCTDKIELLINGMVLFSKSYSPALKVSARYPTPTRTAFAIPQNELRTFWSQLDFATMCQAPASISGASIQRTITGILGDALKTTDDITNGDFDKGGSVTMSRDDASTLRARAIYDATVNAGLEVDIQQTIDFTLAPTCTNGTINMNMSPIRVRDIDGDITYELANILTSGWLEFGAVKLSQDGLNDNLGGLRGSLQELVKDLPLCPGFSIDTASPPNVQIDYSALALLGLDRTQLDICKR